MNTWLFPVCIMHLSNPASSSFLPLSPFLFFLHIFSHTSCHTFTETPSPLIRLTSCHLCRNIFPCLTLVVCLWHQTEGGCSWKWMMVWHRLMKGGLRPGFLSHCWGKTGFVAEKQGEEYLLSITTLHSNYCLTATIWFLWSQINRETAGMCACLWECTRNW